MAWWFCSRLHCCQNTTSSIFLAPKCLPRFHGKFPTRVRFSASQLKGLIPTPPFLLLYSSSAAAPSSADQYRLTSPELVALEYADLNLPHNASLVNSFSFNSLSLFLSCETCEMGFWGMIEYAGIGPCQNQATCQPSQLLLFCMFSKRVLVFLSISYI